MLLASCKEKHEEVADHEVEKKGYKISPVNIQNVKLTDDFWLPIIQRVQETTIDYAIKKCEEEGRLDNFLIAGGQLEGETKGEMPFDDTDVYKIIEGASNSLISAPNVALESKLDSLISIVVVGQEEDGYLTTWRTINPAKPPAEWVAVGEGKRWSSLDASHELYNAGHMYEAAVVHHLATGKNNFLDIALKNADFMVKTFGDGEGQVANVPGHQIIETGLIKLFQLTGKQAYFDLAKYFLDNRGNPEHHRLLDRHSNNYFQDHIPVIEQKEVVGHAVRAVYMYAAMTDIAAINNDSTYLNAVNALWDNMVEKKMYITGGIGSRHDEEAFGDNYSLPNLTAYTETCASIGDVYWNHRLHNLTGDVKYFDIIERTLYNGLISGISLDGTRFFYPNALESDGKFEFNKGSCTRQSWFDCSCCPTNVIRFLPSVPGLVYSKTDDEIYVNLYASNKASIQLKETEVSISQKTDYPWNGKVEIRINPATEFNFTLKLRVPGWARNETLPSNLYQYLNDSGNESVIRINGELVSANENGGYFTITKNWKKGDVIEIDFPMEVKMVKTDDMVEENRGKTALEYGPIVYAIEEIDNPNIDEIVLNKSDVYNVKMEKDLLKGVNTLTNDKLKAIPYYTWSNRGVNKMKVWMNIR